MRACAEAEREPGGHRDLDQRGDHRELLRSPRAGVAHSVEVRQNGVLVGGLYGVALGGAFFGESMFHRATDASKVALVALVERLRSHGFPLLDTQWVTAHLQQFGAIEIPRPELPAGRVSMSRSVPITLVQGPESSESRTYRPVDR